MADTIALMRKRVLDMGLTGELTASDISTWDEIRLSDVCKLTNGEKRSEEDNIYLHVKFLRGTAYEEKRNKGNFVKKDDLVILVDGQNSGEIFQIPFNGYMGSTFRKIDYSEKIDTKYLQLFIKSHQELLRDNKTGSAIPHLNKKLFANLDISLPPLAEQKRIVTKIEEILAVTEKISTKKEEALSIISNMRQTALQDAVMGTLVEQDETDEPASEILKKIEKEKEYLKKEKKVKIEKPLSPVNVHNFDYDMPTGWELTHLNEIAFVTKLAGFEYTSDIKPNLAESGIPLFKGKNVQNGRLVYEFESFIPETVSRKLERSQLNRKCLLTPYVGTIGNIAIFEGDIQAHLGSNVGKIELYNYNDTYILEEYLLYFLRSKTGIKQLRKQIKSTAQESISIKAIRECIIPLPPLAEQERIVEKLDGIMVICDQMEGILNGSSQINGSLKVKQ